MKIFKLHLSFHGEKALLAFTEFFLLKKKCLLFVKIILKLKHTQSYTVLKSLNFRSNQSMNVIQYSREK